MKQRHIIILSLLILTILFLACWPSGTAGKLPASFRNGRLSFEWQFKEQAIPVAMGFVFRATEGSGQSLVIKSDGAITLSGNSVVWQEVGMLTTDGTGDNQTKGKGGTALRIPLQDLAAARYIDFAPLSGTQESIFITLRTTSGIWDKVGTFGPGKQELAPILQKKNASHTHLIIELNGANECYAPVAGQIKVLIGREPEAQAGAYSLITSLIKIGAKNTGELLACGQLLEVRINGELVLAGTMPDAPGSGINLLMPSPVPGTFVFKSIVDFDTAAKHNIHGKLLDKQGAAVAQGNINLYEILENEEARGLPLRLITVLSADEKGAFAFTVPEDRAYLLEAKGIHRIVETRMPGFADREYDIQEEGK